MLRTHLIVRKQRFFFPSRPGRKNRQRAAGFTLVEILIVVIILGILAAIVLPQFSNASQTARQNALKDELRFLRSQIQIYKSELLVGARGFPVGGGTPPEPLYDAQ